MRPELIPLVIVKTKERSLLCIAVKTHTERMSSRVAKKQEEDFGCMSGSNRAASWRHQGRWHNGDEAALGTASWQWQGWALAVAVLVAAMMGGDARWRDGGGAVLRPTWFCGFEVEVVETGWRGDRTIPIFLASSFNFFFGLWGYVMNWWWFVDGGYSVFIFLV